MGVHEVWMDGAAFRKISEAEAEIEVKRKALEEQKKLLQKSRPKKKRTDSTSFGVAAVALHCDCHRWLLTVSPLSGVSPDSEGFPKPRGAKKDRPAMDLDEVGWGKF